jgi:molecular chaperone Hsp33
LQPEIRSTMILAPIQDRETTSHLDSIAADGMDIFLLDGGNYRGALLGGTRMVNQMRANHQLGIMETLILGHAYLAAGLLTSLIKGNDRISLSIDCDGPIGGVAVDANARGEIRGYVKNPDLTIAAPLDSFDTAPFIGEGTLTVTRHLEMAKRPVSGHTRLHHGTIAHDLAHYFVASEQKPTALSLSVQFDHDGRVSGAAALFVQSLPESDQSAAPEIDRLVQGLPSLGTLVAGGDTPSHIVHTYLGAFSPDIIGTRSVEFACGCSSERFADYLASLPPAELADIAENGPFPVKVTCHNCNSTYMYKREEIEELRDSSHR